MRFHIVPTRFAAVLPVALVVFAATPWAVAQQNNKTLSHLQNLHMPNGLRLGDKARDGDKKASPFSAAEATVDNQKWGVVLANSRPVMGVPVAAGGYSPLKRAQLVAERMGTLYKAGARFKEAGGYVVGKLNREIVLALKPANDTGKLDLLFTVDSNLDRLLNASNKGKRVTRADIAFYWRDIMLKALQNEPDIAAPLGEQDAWAKIPAGYARDKSVTPLSESQIHQPTHKP